MLGSFATYGEGKGCCNSGKRDKNNADQQNIMETTSGNLYFSDESNLPKEKQSEENQVRERIVNKYIYRDRPVEKIQYKDRIIEKKIPLTGTIHFSNGKEIWNGELLRNYIELVKEVTGVHYLDENFYNSNAELDIIYKNHKNEFNPNVDFYKVREYLENIKKEELSIFRRFNEIFVSEDDKFRNESVIKDFMMRINNIIYHILLSTYEKTLMELFNYYEVEDKATGTLEKKRNINTCVNIKKRINSVYDEWTKLNFFSDVKGDFFKECNLVVNLNHNLFNFYKKNVNKKNKELSLENLTELLKIDNNNREALKVDEYGNKTKTLIYRLRYSTMQIFIDFITGVNEKILEKLSFLSCRYDSLATLTLKIYSNSTLQDVFLCKDKNQREDQTIYTLIDKIITEDFNTLKRIYDDLCYVDNNMFGSCYGNSVKVVGKKVDNMYDISSLLKLYTTVNIYDGSLCEYIKENIFSCLISGKNDITKKASVNKRMSTLLNTKLAEGSFLLLMKSNDIKKIGHIVFDEKV